jgi:hypothetical protein
MSRTAVYHTTVNWTGAHSGRVLLGNGPALDFSAPPDAQGLAGVLTPEDAFVAAANTCIMLMFISTAAPRHGRRNRMLTIKVLGSGCQNCRNLEAAARRAAAQLGVESEFVKVTDHAPARTDTGENAHAL